VTSSRSPRHIPAIDRLLRHPDALTLEAAYGRTALVDALRAEAGRLRGELAHDDGRPPDDEAIAPGREDGGAPGTEAELARSLLAATARRLGAAMSPGLRAVINATGVVLHTNLGRAPLADAAVRRLAELGPHYAAIEYDLEAGARGRRDAHAEGLLSRLTGAEAAVVVNNNAAATLLVLAALARGREVIVSRGELVEIGGGFRIPDVMAESGAVLREVGTTNRTRVADYAAAIGARTALIFRVHPSNFRIEGFTDRPAPADLAALARRHGVPFAEDLGSGWPGGGCEAVERVLADEPSVRASLAAGTDILCFSGDKLLGGPQAGIIAGRRDLVHAVRIHPLMRAVRADKLTYAALEATLIAWLGGHPCRDVPVARMISLSAAEIGERAGRLCDTLRGVPGLEASVEDGFSTIGGGSAPGSRLPTRLLALRMAGCSVDALEARLRHLPTPVVARIQDDRVLVDLRTVREADDGALADLLRQL
jgi:L-seryl-tRNA(Ser) seleniumtransferase